MRDARVLRSDAGSREHDVAVGRAAHEDGLFTEAGDHSGTGGHHAARRMSRASLSRGCRATVRGGSCGVAPEVVDEETMSNISPARHLDESRGGGGARAELTLGSDR